MKRIVSILILALALTTTLTAQNNGRTKFATDMYQAKHEMIIQEVGLTQTQQKQFMPLYEQMEREIYQVNRNARALANEVEKKKNPSDRDYEVAASALSNTRVQEGDIEAKYFEKFSKILSKKQLFQLKQTERKFTQEMLSKKRKRQ
jgi:Spy/CpxP family protein refolding chaperone